MGKWGGQYIGVDFSDEMIAKAREQYPDSEKASFFIGSFQQVKDVLRKKGIPFGFDIILVNGVSMYINDEEIPACLDSLNDMAAQRGILYMKESCGISERLTLKNFYSDELTHNYNAIYRSNQEYEDLLTQQLANFKLSEHGPLFPDEMNNREETADYYWIFKN